VAQGTPGRAAGRLAAWRDRDHTRGSLLASLLVLALPMMASSLLVVAFQLADLGFISRLGEAPMTAVIIVNQTLRQFVMMLVMGMSFGTQALIARAVGEGDAERAEHIAGQVVLLGGVAALVVAGVGLVAADALFSLPGPDESFRPYGVPYLRLVYLCTFGMMGVQLFAAILGGAGDTTTPFFVTVVQTGVGVFAEWALIFGHLGAPELGVRGVALGIAAGQVVAMTLGLVVLFRGRSRVHLRARHLRPDPKMMRQVLKLSWPPAIQMATNVAMTFTYLRLAGQFGETVQTAYAVGLRLGMIVPMIGFPLAGAAATLVGQALGAGDARRAWQAIRVGLLVHGAVMWSLSLVLLAFRRDIMGLLSSDPQVIAVGAEYLLFLAGALFAWAFYFVFLRSLQGAGDMLVPMVISLCSTLLAIPLAIGLALHTELGRQGIWVAFLCASWFSTLGTGLRVATGRWARRASHSAPTGTHP
jgi:putative MATE family efflux protein